MSAGAMPGTIYAVDSCMRTSLGMSNRAEVRKRGGIAVMQFSAVLDLRRGVKVCTAKRSGVNEVEEGDGGVIQRR
jgi:hypothetical protein